LTELERISPEERFQNLLRDTKTERGDALKYRRRLAQVAVSGLRSVVVDFGDLLVYDEALARLILESPDRYLESVNRAAFSQLRIEDPDYAESIGRLVVRFRGIPESTPLRKVGSPHIGNLVMVEGILVRATSIKPLLTRAAFRCRRCETVQFLPQSGIFLNRPLSCANPACRERSPPQLVESDSEFINSQEVRIQERPEDLPPGQLPRTINIKLIDDLVDTARPGDRVSVIGVVRAYQESSSRGSRLRTFDMYIEGNHVDVAGREAEMVRITPEEENQIIEMGKDPWIYRKIIRAIAPSIYGYDDIKEAITLLLLSGLHKVMPDGVAIRGDLNVLLIGDPGTAKSQLLQYVSRIAPRGLYTSGRGTTAAGLTAAVLRERSGGMALEAGALVLADKGVCCIDEFDKMKPEDRVAIHEAMEQQTVSVAKGGIVATLNARTSILAAANPSMGRYDPYRTVADNINLPVTVLSRFDLIFILRDEPEKEQDARMSAHILSLHGGKAVATEVGIPPELLRKYITYARRLKPVLSDDAVRSFHEFYLMMRSVSEGADASIAITPRQLESLVRLSEARARACLRDVVTVEDAEGVISLMKKCLEQVGIDVSTGKYDIDIIMTGKPKTLRDKLLEVLSSISELEQDIGMVKQDDLLDHLESEYGIGRNEAERLISQLQREGTVYSPKPGFLKKT
jgi:replicative DNA helicase Mcm